jgi:hypothetical protein
MSHGRRRAAAAAVLAGAALLAGACGGGSHPGAASPGSDQLTARGAGLFARCMRSHGVAGFYFSRAGSSSSNPDGNYIQLGPWKAQDPGTPQFQAAATACSHLFPGGPAPPVTQRQKNQMLKFAACMRAHGYPGYPDPRFPGSGGVMRQQPSGIDTSSQQFQATAKACSAASRR